MTSVVKIHQALHGYRDGHQLLASSIDLSPEQNWQLLVLTDLSGPEFREGFETYITGYPIVGGGYYCFARTWYAPELPRPGCVWTHTLLIPDSAVAQISDFRSISHLWQRPELGRSSDGYQMELQATPIAEPAVAAVPSFCMDVLEKLYGQPASTVIMESDDSTRFEDLALGILNQQWPRLRRTFRFCTGALSDRDLAFDLLVSPPSAIRPNEDRRKHFVLSSDPIERSSFDSWITVATADLIAADPTSELRQFLWKFGPEYSDGRASFQPLCETFFASTRREGMPEYLLTVIAHCFPEVHSGGRLKAYFLGPASDSRRSASEQADLLRALVFHPGGHSIPPEVARLSERARSAVHANFSLATAIALSALEAASQQSQEFLAGFYVEIATSPQRISGLPLPLIYELLRRNPESASSWELWRRPAAEQLAIAGRLSSIALPGELGGRVVTAALTAGAMDAASVLLSHIGADGVRGALAWFDSHENSLKEVPEVVRRALAEHREDIIAVLRTCKCGPHALRVASTVLDPRSAAVHSFGPGLWAQIGAGVAEASWMSGDLRSCAFLLGLGLTFRDQEAATLVRLGFSAVYEAAREDRLGDYLWGFVEPSLPWYLLYWDRCARLVRGVARQFARDDWPEAEFLRTFGTAEQVSRAFDEARWADGGLHLLGRVCASLQTGRAEVSEELRHVVVSKCSGIEGAPPR
jgi:GTPase-associated protein 1, N-terminal domain type 1